MFNKYFLLNDKDNDHTINKFYLNEREKKMDYNQFLTTVNDTVLDFIPNNEGLEVVVNKIRKTNDVVLDGLSIIKKDCKTSISPTIYLNPYYSEYEQGRELKDIIKEISKIYILNTHCYNSFNLDLGKKDNVYVSVINKDLNKELLKDTPYIDFEDLAIVFRHLAQRDEHGVGSVLLKDFMLNNVDLDELYKSAIENTKKFFGISVKTMDEVIHSILKSDGVPEEDILQLMRNSSSPSMYVVTNEAGVSGASTILMNDIFEDLSNNINSDLYIIPSSIHELIVVPANNQKPDELKSMVLEVNTEQVSKEERLSNNIYIYDRNKKEVRLYSK